MWRLLALLAAVVFTALLFQNPIKDAYRRQTGRLQIDGPGGCLTVHIDGDTRFDDYQNRDDREFWIHHGAGIGAIAWGFYSRLDNTNDKKFTFRWQNFDFKTVAINGAGCHVLEDFGPLKHVARQIGDGPEVPYAQCTMIQHRVYPTYMLFDDAGSAVAEVQCNSPDSLSCTGNVAVDGHIFRLGIFHNDIQDLPRIRSQMTDIVRDRMEVHSTCSLW